MAAYVLLGCFYPLVGAACAQWKITESFVKGVKGKSPKGGRTWAKFRFQIWWIEATVFLAFVATAS